MGFRRHFGSWLVGALAVLTAAVALAIAAASSHAGGASYYISMLVVVLMVLLLFVLVSRAQSGAPPALEWSLPDAPASAEPPAQIADLGSNLLTILYIGLYAAAIPVIIFGHYEVVAVLAVILVGLMIFSKRSKPAAH